MIADMTSDKAHQKKGAAKPGARKISPERSTSPRKVAAKPALTQPAKPGSKLVPNAPEQSVAKARKTRSPEITTKVATKAVAKPARKPAKDDQNAAKRGKAVKGDKNAKPKKAKVVRDSFTMPELEYELIAAVKRRCVANGLAVKKSEVLRAAIISFAALSDRAAAAALQALPVIKTGRPAKMQK